MFDIYSTNTNSLDYYVFYLIGLFSLYTIVVFINASIKKSYPNTTLNVSLDVYGKEQHIQIIHDAPTLEQKNLRWNFLAVSSMIKAATWVKAPYIFALYNRVHQFTRAEIGVLYAVDNLSALIFGPIIGTLSDMYGRRKFCLLFSVVVVMHIYLRVTGIQLLAYPAQVLNGISGSILETVFESWLNFEANMLFDKSQEGEMKKNNYLKEIFNKQVYIDCICSIFLTGIATFLYIQFGILYPFYACMGFSFVAGVMVLLLWQENDLIKYKAWVQDNTQYVHDVEKVTLIRKESKENLSPTLFSKLSSAWETIRAKKELLVVGIIESSFKICLALFLFFWTPLLEETAHNLVHPGTIYVCFMVARLIGSEAFQCFKIILTTNSYYLTIFVTATTCLSFFVDYISREFYVIFLMLVYFDGVSGLFQPLMSSIKSELIEEEKRTTIMTFFRLPINFFAIITLILTKVISTKQICFIAFLIMLLASVVNLYLIKIHEPADVKNRKIQKTSALEHH